MDVTGDQATVFLHQTIPAVGRLGVVVEEFSPGLVRLCVPIEGNGNHFGTMYAGVLFTLCELPGGLLPVGVLDPTKYTPIVTELDIRFLAAARTDVRLEARMDPAELQALAEQADREGRARFTLELHAEDADGRTVVSSTAHYQLRRNRG
ncbi:MAG TPA: YiiD C-terminal domain-containing protein [Actinomycetota bacterium]|nr:YiiD C-terminal domain-containing protein [Actinomycetota bacterium]